MKKRSAPKLKGLLFILSAPSGVGKSTLARAVVGQDPRFEHSVSTTTRMPRPGERNGRDYCFVTEKQFMELVKQKKFLEHARVHNSLYGTTKAFLDKSLVQGKYLILTIDVQGAKNVAAAYPENTVRIFILPPDTRTWMARLKQRKENEWKTRMANARHEVRHLSAFDYVLVNDNLEHACRDFFAIVRAEELKRAGRNFKLNFN